MAVSGTVTTRRTINSPSFDSGGGAEQAPRGQHPGEAAFRIGDVKVDDAFADAVLADCRQRLVHRHRLPQEREFLARVRQHGILEMSLLGHGDG